MIERSISLKLRNGYRMSAFKPSLFTAEPADRCIKVRRTGPSSVRLRITRACISLSSVTVMSIVLRKRAQMRRQYGVDGIMIGRAAIGYPWIFNEIKHYFATGELLPLPSIDERIAVFRKHLDFSIKWKGLRRGLLEMRRHYTNYFKGIPHVKPFRYRLVTCDSYDGVLGIVAELRTHALMAAAS